jgi:hypothetical protein
MLAILPLLVVDEIRSAVARALRHRLADEPAQTAA